MNHASTQVTTLDIFLGTGTGTVNATLTSYYVGKTKKKLQLNYISSVHQYYNYTTLHVSKFEFVLYSTANINWTKIDMTGTYPTPSPTRSPSRTPTHSPTRTPTKAPVLPPTSSPSRPPTAHPTGSPTFGVYAGRTADQYNGLPTTTVQWSTNIYPLAQRHDCGIGHNETCTYKNYVLPPTSHPSAYCLTCILSWDEIDAKLTIEGCPLNFTNEGRYPGETIASPYFFCDTGTFYLQSTGRLTAWQQTYLALEIWEYDQMHQKYQQFSKEFQWNQTMCEWNNSGTITACTYLPLTGQNKYTAKIDFSMPKGKYDNRQNPLLVVWYDILAIPYGVRPPLVFEYKNLSLIQVSPGNAFSFNELLTTGAFRIPFYCMVTLFILFLLVSIGGLLKGKRGRNIAKSDYIIDTRNLRSVFQNLPETMVVEEKLLKSRSKFKVYKHGPYLCIVLLGRLAYMFVFTLTFFYLVFQSVNQQHYQVLRQYHRFAQSRDNQLWNLSAEIETYYNNETQDMANEAAFEQRWCYDVWILTVAAAYTNKTLTRFDYDTHQMKEPLRRFKGLNLTGANSMYVGGTTACDTNAVNGAREIYYDYMCVLSNKTKNETCYDAKYYNRTFANFSKLENALIQTCLHTSNCVGWTWIDPTSKGSHGHFAVLSAFSTPQFTKNTSGICYLVARYNSNNTFSMSAVDNLAQINTQLDTQYLNAYQSNVGSLYSTLQGMFSSLKALNGFSSQHFNVSVKVIADPTATAVSTKVIEKHFKLTTDGSTIQYYLTMEIEIICPYCPQGNFSQPVLQRAYNKLFNNTNFNASNLGNHSHFNFSDIVSVNTALVQVPSIPSITLPLDIHIPHIGLPIYWFLGFDTLLTIYRWYRTAGILANVIRGKDIEIELRHLMVRSKKVLCCPTDVNVGDQVLTSIIYCSGYCNNVTYTCWKLFYWIWLLVQLTIILCVLLLAYYFIDQVINVNFIKQLDIFPLLTSGLAAQRLVRNSVICTTALSYNNYTLSNMELSRREYAIQKNLQVVEWNRGELERVNGYNSFFCPVWNQHMGTVRDVTQDGYALNYSGSPNLGRQAKQTLSHLFDGLTNTTWQPYNASYAKSLIKKSGKTVSINIELPLLQLTWTPHPNHSAYWRIDHVDFTWNFNKSNSQGYNSTYGSVPFAFYLKQNGSKSFVATSSSSNKYSASDYNKHADVQSVYLYNSANETRYIRINFSSAQDWVDAFELDGITIFGKISSQNIYCPYVIYKAITFDASNSAYNNKYCPGVQPIFGVMYRHFVRSWLDDELWKGHVPFIIAIRAICLSPFYILVIAIGGLICGYLVAFMIEWILSAVDLLRENPYAAVPLVYSREHYDKSRHEPQAFKDATIAHDYYRPDLQAMMDREEANSPKTTQYAIYNNVELQARPPMQQANIEPVPDVTATPRSFGLPLRNQEEGQGTANYGQQDWRAKSPKEVAAPPQTRLPPKVPKRPPRRQSAEIDYPMTDMPEQEQDQTTEQQQETEAEEHHDYDDA